MIIVIIDAIVFIPILQKVVLLYNNTVTGFHPSRQRSLHFSVLYENIVVLPEHLNLTYFIYIKIPLSSFLIW